MTFLAPGRLWLLVLPLALLAAYVVAQRARRRHAVRFTNLDLLASVAPRRPGWRRHVAAAGLLAAMLLMVTGFARPVFETQVPRESATIVLALDVSMSMAAADVSPSRLVAAQKAAREFVTGIPQPLRVGLLTFAGTTALRVPPTTDRTAVVEAIDALSLAPGTAIGEAIFDSVGAAGEDAVTDTGEKSPAHVVLMSDGATTGGRSNEEAAAMAASTGIPVTTIAYGTDSGTVVVEGRTIHVPVDRDALRAIAETTGGRYFAAEDAGELEEVYEDIGRTVGYETEQREVTAVFTGLALALATAAAVASLLWTARLP